MPAFRSVYTALRVPYPMRRVCSSKFRLTVNVDRKEGSPQFDQGLGWCVVNARSGIADTPLCALHQRGHGVRRKGNERKLAHDIERGDLLAGVVGKVVEVDGTGCRVAWAQPRIGCQSNWEHQEVD